MSSRSVFFSNKAHRTIRFEDSDWPIRSWPALSESLAELDGNAAAIFAAPVQTEAGLQWEADAVSGDTTPFADAPRALQAEARPRIEAAVHAVEMSGNPELGPLLMIESADAIRVAPDGTPAIAGWGAVPDEAGTPEGMREHYAATLGPFSATGLPPHDFSSGWTWSDEPPGHVPGWRPAAAVLGVLALIFVVSLIPGVLGREAAQGGASDALVEEALLREIEEYERLLEGGVCTPQQAGPVEPSIVPRQSFPPPDADVPPDPQTGTDMAQSPPSEPVLPDSREVRPPEDPSDLAIPPQLRPESDDAVVFLRDLIDHATVLVIYQRQQGNMVMTANGSGFFVNATDVLTNRHVVEESGGVQIYVGNREIGRLVPVEIVTMSPDSGIGNRDLALLRAAEPVAPATLSFTDDLARLQNVIAAGFPFVVLNTDPRFNELKRDLEAAVTAADLPEIVPTFGRVMARQPRNESLQIILHRASISPGNSGGPLLDECGRLAGINTFVAPEDNEGSDRIFYAQNAGDAVRFLAENGIEVPTVEGECLTASAAPLPEAPAEPAGDPPAEDTGDAPDTAEGASDSGPESGETPP